MTRWFLCWLLAAAAAPPATAGSVEIPAGTRLFVELDERVSSKRQREADTVRAHVWRDVVVDGRPVIREWTPVAVRVAGVRKARMAGRKGQLELEAVSVPAVDGREVPLTGGYDHSGRGRKGAAIGLVVVSPASLLLKGKQAVLESGTIFDATVAEPVEVRAGGESPAAEPPPGLEASVLYDEIDLDDEEHQLPLLLRAAGREIDGAGIATVNGVAVWDLPLALEVPDEDGAVRATVAFKALSKHFRKGINRFEVRAGEETAEVVLELEL